MTERQTNEPGPLRIQAWAQRHRTHQSRQGSDFAWFKGNAAGNDPPVGKKKPNPWGLYDMHGYVLEWCLDAWHPNYEGAPTDGSARDAPGAKERVARGGSWADGADEARSAFRLRLDVRTLGDSLGFRCVKAKVKGKA